MGYMHISNLHKAQEILAFRECYALEKIHGTSAHISWKDGRVTFSSGGESYDRFASLFDVDVLTEKFKGRFLPETPVVVYGEAYGGKQQQMSATYGKELRFVAFEVKVGDVFLAVPQAVDWATVMGLEFVDFALVSTDIDSLNAERDKPSTQAVRNGIIEPKIREGIVLRPPFEARLNNGDRLIAKYKREEFAERGRPKLDDMDPTKREVMEQRDAIAVEWVTPMRLEHVIDAVISGRDSKDLDIKDTSTVIAAMVEDLTREAAGEIVDNQMVRRAIASRTAVLFKQRLSRDLEMVA